jgi:hypothetical protein
MGMERGKERRYEVVLGPEAERFIILGCSFDERKELANCLKTELQADNEEAGPEAQATCARRVHPRSAPTQ